ncbi:MAG: DNA polymerase I [Verrucomicrobia bacterium]|nr:MAG: DNA polymerase I [Verrucomicrobiota bacterium]
MSKKLFLLDGMALAYRAHFAFLSRPIYNSKGMNTSALYGFTATLIDLITKENPTHLAIAFDTPEPTARHKLYEPYKANRDKMPEDLAAVLPHLSRIAEAFKIPVVRMPGYEADDIIGTLATRAEQKGYDTYMVTPDKDFGQLVSDRVFMYRPSYKGDPPEIQDAKAVCEKWGIERTDQVIDILGLSGDASDNIPGVPGVGPKTAQKLLERFDSLEGVLANVDQLKGKQQEKIRDNAEQARLSYRLATIDREVPVTVGPDGLIREEPNLDTVRALFSEFEFRTLGKRIFGSEFSLEMTATGSGESKADIPTPGTGQLELLETTPFRTLADTPHTYHHVHDDAGRRNLVERLAAQESFCFDTETTGLNARHAEILGLAIAIKPGEAWYVEFSRDPGKARAELAEFRSIFVSDRTRKIGHNLKFDLAVLKNHGIEVAGPFFDTMLAHALVEPEQKHGMDSLAESILDYKTVHLDSLLDDGAGRTRAMTDIPAAQLAVYAAEDADITLQLCECLAPLLKQKGQERIFFEIECPLIPVLVDMEAAGIALDSSVLHQYSLDLGERIESIAKSIIDMVGHEFNLNSPKQLGEILFDELKLVEKPKKTRTGQYATNEQVLTGLAGVHPIIQAILDYRGLTKLKGTYVDTLPESVDPADGRVHTHFGQLHTITGRLQSNGPNLQNIPVRTSEGREIRKAFVAGNPDSVLLSADYSQIELRIIAAISQDPGLIGAFEQGLDIHAATAARIYGVDTVAVTREMRGKAKMVNFGIPYGISAFGLAQRLGINRNEAGGLIDQYFSQFSGVRDYINRTLESAREKGYVETIKGRRRTLRDINSGNGTVRSAAERNAINMPIQGTAADMIKIAMARVHQRIREKGLKTRLLLQVHDELVFEVPKSEIETVRPIIVDAMSTALQLEVPIVVDTGAGRNWLEAH